MSRYSKKNATETTTTAAPSVLPTESITWKAFVEGIKLDKLVEAWEQELAEYTANTTIQNLFGRFVAIQVSREWYNDNQEVVAQVHSDFQSFARRAGLEPKLITGLPDRTAMLLVRCSPASAEETAQVEATRRAFEQTRSAPGQSRWSRTRGNR